MWSFSKETIPDSNRESSCEGENSKELTESRPTLQKSSAGECLDVWSSPNQPHPNFLRVQKLPDKVLRFQENWYSLYPWLHHSPAVEGILCFYCVKTYTISKSTLSKKADTAFSSKGFTNWKNARLRFECHQNSKAHHHAVTVCSLEGTTVDTQLSSAWARQQENGRHCLKSIANSIQYLARLGLALRGHTADEGNFYQHLKSKAKDDALLSNWLTRSQDYTSPLVQNEILQLLSNNIVREIVKSIQALPILQYSIIIDGTQDMSGVEQESICIRYVDHDLVPHEMFIGLYEVSSTTGEAIAKVARDVLLRLNIPIDGLRGQTYDGAANMSGIHSGVQAEIKRQQPLALYVHCGSHCVNLVTQAACQSSPLVRDALQWTHELGTLTNMSGKFKGIFSEVAAASEGPSTSLKPLCPTRWTVRGPAVRAVLSQYESVLTSLEEMGANSGTSTGAKANGLSERFQKGKTVLGLLLTLEVIEVLECLNKSLQKRTETISGMKIAIDCARSTIRAKRSETRFQQIFDKAVEMVDTLKIEPIQVPHQRQPPKRYTGGASQHIAKTPEEWFRVEYYKMLDCVDVQFEKRFNQPDLKILQDLDNVLLSGEVSPIISEYPELKGDMLKIQLSMFHSNYKIKSSWEAANLFRNMPVEVRRLFDQVETLLRLLLVIPVSSAEAERSFSALRRLKTWLRTTMTQARLNHTAVCHVHQDVLDNIDTREICQQFIGMNDRRRHSFGSFKS